MENTLNILMYILQNKSIKLATFKKIIDRTNYFKQLTLVEIIRLHSSQNLKLILDVVNK